MTITSKFSGTCRVCNKAFQAGAKIEWQRGTKPCHAGCAPVQGAQASGTRSVARGAITALQNDTYEEDYGRSLAQSEGF